MFDVNGNKITISRQDVGVFTISFTGTDAPDDGTIVLVTLKREPLKVSEPIWEKRIPVENSKVTVNLSSTDSDIPDGEYYWDARILFSDDEPFTPMTPAIFKVLGVVGDV